MKQFILSVLLIFAGAIFLSPVASVSHARGAAKNVTARDRGFSVIEYQSFHDVLYPLQHEALPQKDFKRIRAAAAKLVALGEAIVKVGVPRGVDKNRHQEFKAGLKTFGAALVKFKADADKGTDDQLKQSYSAVHDSFETLAAMLAR
jgi:hypothetical protein